MEINVGQFKGYLPDKDPTDLILSLLSRAFNDKEHKIEPSFLHNFIFSIKKDSPELFESIHFSETSFFPYSEEIDLAMHELKGTGFIVRPNPKYASFTIAVDSPIDAAWMSNTDKKNIQKFAERLSKELSHANR